MKVFNNLFIYCNCTNGNGGAIYINCQEQGELFLEKNCGFECKTFSSGGGQFGSITISNKNNFVQLISIVKPSNEDCGTQTFSLSNGNCSFFNSNISNNITPSYSAILFSTFTSMNMKYCSITNNTVVSHICINLYSGSIIGRIFNSNIIKNNSPGYGIICYYGNFEIYDSIIKDNLNSFAYRSAMGSVTLINSWISHLTMGDSSISGTNLGLTNLFPFLHFQTFKCFALNPFKANIGFSFINLKKNSWKFLRGYIFQFFLNLY